MNQFDEVGYEESVSSKVELLNRQSRKPQARTIYLSRHNSSRKQRSKTHYKRVPSYNSISSVDSAEVLDYDQYAIEPSKLSNILCDSFFNQSIINFNLQRQKIRCVSSIDHSEEQQPIKQTQHSQRSIKFFQSPAQASETKTKFRQRESFQVMQPNLTSNNNNSRFSLFQQQQSLNNSQYTIDLPLNNDCLSLNSNSRKLIHISDRDLLNQIIELLFKKDIQFLRQLLLQMQIEYRNDALNQLDHNGNTPLMLAVKLNYKSPSIEMVRSLLQYGSDPSIKDSNKWSPLEESVSQRDVATTGLLFDYIVKKKQMDLQRERVAIDQELLLLDDFYIEMKWEFQSSIIPFLSKIAPHDVFKIYKRNTSLRLDSTFVGQSNYKAKRRDITVLYNPLIGQRQRKENSTQCKFVTVLNKSKGIYFYPMTEIDPDEKKLILVDLLNSDNVLGDMKVIDCQLNKSKSIFGNYIQSQIGEWKCNKYDFKVKTEQCFNKKNHNPFLLNFQQYTLSILEKKSSTRYNIDSLASKLLDTVSLSKQESSRSVDTKSKSSKNNCQLHITDQFPIKFASLLPILKMLSKGNQFMQSMLKILEDESVSQVIKQNGFPLKITVPVNFTVDAVVTFQAFKRDLSIRSVETGLEREEAATSCKLIFMINQIELTDKYSSLKVVDWAQGEEEYGEDFIPIAMSFVKKTLFDQINNGIHGVETEDWALFFSAIHGIKGSGGYARTEKLNMICCDAQSHLLQHITKVNPKGKTPAEQYEVKDSLQAGQKLVALIYFNQVLEAAVEVCNQFIAKGEDIQVESLPPIQTKLKEFINKYQKSSFGQSQSLQSAKYQVSRSVQSFQSNQLKQENKQSQQMEVISKDSSTGETIDKPAEGGNCCQQCIVF